MKIPTNIVAFSVIYTTAFASPTLSFRNHLQQANIAECAQHASLAVCNSMDELPAFCLGAEEQGMNGAQGWVSLLSTLWLTYIPMRSETIHSFLSTLEDINEQTDPVLPQEYPLSDPKETRSEAFDKGSFNKDDAGPMQVANGSDIAVLDFYIGIILSPALFFVFFYCFRMAVEAVVFIRTGARSSQRRTSSAVLTTAPDNTDPTSSSSARFWLRSVLRSLSFHSKWPAWKNRRQLIIVFYSRVFHRQDEFQHLCVVCMEEFEQDTFVEALKCGHIYHEQCIERWLLHYRQYCPICKDKAYTTS